MGMVVAVLSLIVGLAGLMGVVLILLWVRRPVGREMEQALRDELRISREESTRQARDSREEVATTLESVRKTTEEKLAAGGELQRRGIEDLKMSMTALTDTIRGEMTSHRDRVQTQLQAIQSTNEQRFEKVRETVIQHLQKLLEDQRRQMVELVDSLQKVTESNRQDQEKIRDVLEQKFSQIQENNEKKLDEMRQTVDEKLHNTLEKRLGESFKQVSERLEAVQRGLGEMQTLATGVGDLKRVLTNVKERGTWGEYQLEAILSEILTPDQYARNVKPKEGGECVEFAVRLPGRGSEADKPVWLPIDAKFPKEDYERLLDAANQADPDGVKAAGKALAGAIQKAAKDIHDKYIAPPATTDFGIMFLPTEGLYAEVLRQAGLQDELQRKYRVLVAGPTTLSAILSSLRVGFQTLAIEKRAHEVWKVLGAVKTEFGKFSGIFEKVQKQLQTASKTLDQSAQRTRVMERRLRSVEQLPPEQAAALLALPDMEVAEAKDEGSEKGHT